MRLVLDTNVVVSAVVWGGVPYQLLQAATAGTVDLYTSPFLLDELRRILARPHLTERCATPQAICSVLLVRQKLARQHHVHAVTLGVGLALDVH